jgi:transketolase
MASGSEVSLIIEAGKGLAESGVAVRLVSFPSWELFNEQDPAYRDSVLLPDVQRRLAVEAGVSLGWERWTGCKGATLGLDRFGVSAPGKTAFEKLGFTTDHVVEMARELLERN